jgi:hypothetical protein
MKSEVLGKINGFELLEKGKPVDHAGTMIPVTEFLERFANEETFEAIFIFCDQDKDEFDFEYVRGEDNILRFKIESLRPLKDPADGYFEAVINTRGFVLPAGINHGRYTVQMSCDLLVTTLPERLVKVPKERTKAKRNLDAEVIQRRVAKLVGDTDSE